MSGAGKQQITDDRGQNSNAVRNAPVQLYSIEHPASSTRHHERKGTINKCTTLNSTHPKQSLIIA